MYTTTEITVERCDDDGRVSAVPGVRVWNVYTQGWCAYPVGDVPAAVLASLPEDEREMAAG